MREGATRADREKCLPGRGNGLCKGEWRVGACLAHRRNGTHGGPSTQEGRRGRRRGREVTGPDAPGLGKPL